MPAHAARRNGSLRDSALASSRHSVAPPSSSLLRFGPRQFGHRRLARAASLALAVAAVAACSDLPPPPIGQLRLGLESGAGTEVYRLTQARFALTGTSELELSSRDDPDGRVLQRSLPTGTYQVSLLDGWVLVRRGGASETPVRAELVSPNPLDFEIAPGELTSLTFQFQTERGAVGLGAAGRVRFDIEVDGVAAPHVVINELMRDPSAMPDAEGEWIELYNAGSDAVDLDGCSIARDDRSLALSGQFPIPSGGFLTFANGESPGFSPDVLYRGITLPNSGSFSLQLTCDGQLLDEVTVDAEAHPNSPGRSLSLSQTLADSIENDAPNSWCNATETYSADFGTPGGDNGVCIP